MFDVQLKQEHLFAGRVGKLRAYGNGLDAEMAKEFVGTVMEIIKVDGCCGRKITDSAGEFEWSDFNIPRFKRLGVLAGIPDLVIIKPGGNVYLLELKAGKGSLQDSQNATRHLDMASTVQARAVA